MKWMSHKFGMSCINQHRSKDFQALAGGLLLEFEWEQVSSSLQYSTQYSVRYFDYVRYNSVSLKDFAVAVKATKP